MKIGQRTSRAIEYMAINDVQTSFRLNNLSKHTEVALNKDHCNLANYSGLMFFSRHC